MKRLLFLLLASFGAVSLDGDVPIVPQGGTLGRGSIATVDAQAPDDVVVDREWYLITMETAAGTMDLRPEYRVWFFRSATSVLEQSQYVQYLTNDRPIVSMVAFGLDAQAGTFKVSDPAGGTLSTGTYVVVPASEPGYSSQLTLTLDGPAQPPVTPDSVEGVVLDAQGVVVNSYSLPGGTIYTPTSITMVSP